VSVTAAGGLESAARAPDRPVSRFACFDGLRAIAALTIVVTHCAFLTGANSYHWLGPAFARFDIGVAIFFLISGFLLYRPFVASHLEGRPGPAIGPFFRRRALRIFPAYWLALTVILLVGNAPAEQRDLGSLVRYYSLLHIYDAQHVLGPIAQAWSLGTELSFYLFLPLYAAFLATRGTTPAQRLRAQLTGVGVLYAVSVAFRLAALAFDWPNNGMLSVWLVATTDYFALGMLLAIGSVWWARRAPADLPLGLGRRWAPAAAWALAALAFWAVATQLGIPRDRIEYTPWQQMMRQLLYGVTALFLLLPAVFGPQDRGLIRGLLRSRAAVLLGLISYGIYLWHNLFLSEYLERTDRAEFTGDFGHILLVVVVLTVVTATVSYVVVEKPALAWKDRRPDRGRADHVPAG
jgi:peptidoglycan/LPS O-acetylase OafA/YrhL